MLTAAAVFGAVAATPAGALAADKHAAMVIDANTGRVLYAKSADEPRFPASLTKMMTLYIVFELMHQGRLEPSTPIRMSRTAAGTAPSKLDLEVGAEIALIDAIKALITKSANDVAVAIAEHISGTEEKFARLMTQKARALGMTSTVFRNAHGLPDPNQVTTARDMIKLALHLGDDYPRYYRLFATRRFSYGGETYRNHNTLLGRYEGIDGIKTGYTRASGFNLVTSVHRDGKHVVAAVFGGSTAKRRNATMRALLDRGLAKASTRKTREPQAVAKMPAPPPRRARQASVAEEAPQPVRSAAAETDRSAERQMTRTPRIDIARVRPVLVAPRERRTAGEPSRPVALAATHVQPASTSFAETRSLADDAAAPIRGSAPSSLDAQALRLARGETPTGPAARAASHIYSPARFDTPLTATAANTFAVQVGAFTTENEARQQLQNALDRSGGVLDGRLPTTQPIRQGGRQLYRARFAGFDSHGAASACQELKRRQIDCLVARVE